jgi:hypothetical protein
VQLVLELVFDVVVEDAAGGLGEEVRDVVRTAELEADDVVDLERPAV